MINKIILIYNLIGIIIVVDVDAVLYNREYWDFDKEPDIVVRRDEEFRNTRDFDKLFDMEELRTLTVKSRSRGRPTTAMKTTGSRGRPGRPSTSFLLKNLTKKRPPSTFLSDHDFTKKRRGRPRIICDDERVSKIASLRALTATTRRKRTNKRILMLSTRPLSG